jgi:hypothetical protein
MLFVALSSLLLAAPQEASVAPPPVAQEIQEIQEIQDKEMEIGDQKWNETILIPDGVELLKEKSLPFVPLDAFPPSVERNTNFMGMRYFRVEIAPGQKFRATIKVAGFAAYKINFVVPQDATEAKHPMFPRLKNAVSFQNDRNGSFIELKNTSKEPYGVTFNVTGYEEKSYTITIKRTGGQ